MKYKITYLLILFMCSSVYAIDKPTKIRITNGEWEPYHSKLAYQYGFNSHVVARAFELAGIKVEWGFFNWNRSYELAKSGEWDASATWLTTSNVERDFLLSPPIHETSFVFFHLSNKSINWNDFEHLSGLHIGLTRGYEYGEEFHQAIKNFNLTTEVFCHFLTTYDARNLIIFPYLVTTKKNY